MACLLASYPRTDVGEVFANFLDPLIDPLSDYASF